MNLSLAENFTSANIYGILLLELVVFLFRRRKQKTILCLRHISRKVVRKIRLCDAVYLRGVLTWAVHKASMASTLAMQAHLIAFIRRYILLINT
jgi:hypothetical protein